MKDRPQAEFEPRVLKETPIIQKITGTSSGHWKASVQRYPMLKPQILRLLKQITQFFAILAQLTESKLFSAQRYVDVQLSQAKPC